MTDDYLWRTASKEKRDALLNELARQAGSQTGSYLSSVVEDTTPQLGGDLDCNGKVVTSLKAGSDVDMNGYSLQMDDGEGIQNSDGSDVAILSGKTVKGSGSIIVQVLDGATDTAVADGKAYFTIPRSLDGANLVRVHARVITAGTTGTTDIQIANVTDSVDMLSTKLTIDSTETSSATAATPAVIDPTKDDVAENDLLRIDIDAVSTTAAKGLIVRLEFERP